MSPPEATVVSILLLGLIIKLSSLQRRTGKKKKTPVKRDEPTLYSENMSGIYLFIYLSVCVFAAGHNVRAPAPLLENFPSADINVVFFASALHTKCLFWKTQTQHIFSPPSRQFRGFLGLFLTRTLIPYINDWTSA